MAERQIGYRVPIADTTSTPTGEILAPTSAEEAELDRQASRERTRSTGMAVTAGVLLYWLAPHVDGSSYLYPALVVGAGALFLASVVTRLVPRGIGPVLIRLSPPREVRAGQRLDVAVVLRPRDRLTLDSLMICLVGTSVDNGRERVVHESKQLVADGDVVPEGTAVRVETTFLVPADAPPTSSKPRVRYGLHVFLGRPLVYRRTVTVRVGAALRGRRVGARGA